MGILDEAIREHLDLKRRRGADPGEVAKQEGEVFGPSRHIAADAAPDAEHDFDAPAPAEALEPQTHLRLADDQPELLEPEFEQQAEAEQPPAVQPESVGQETRAFDPDEVRAAAGGSEAPSAEDVVDEDPENEDVLDETPEFLAETPEHDRLWFEQRPPRDFDF